MNITKTEQISVSQTVKKQEEKQKPKEENTMILKLKQKPKPRVSWTEGTIDNEGMNKKKSNLCCIYHRPGEDSSDTCTSDDEGNALERDRHTKHMHKKKCSKLRKKREEQEQKKREEEQKIKGQAKTQE